MIALLLLLAIGGLMHAAGTFASSAGTSGTLLSFGYLLLVAFFAGRIVERAGLPRVTGYLLAGIASGPFVLGLVSTTMTANLRIVNGVATSILGLVAGAELDLAAVRPFRRALRRTMVFAVIGSMCAIGAVLYGIRSLLPIFDGLPLVETIAMCALVAVALVPQSPAIVMALIAETRAEGRLSRFMLASVVVSDLVVVLVYSIVGAVASTFLGAGVDVVTTALVVGWELIGSIAFGVAIGMLIGAFVRSVASSAPMFALLVCVVVSEIGRRIHLDPLIVMLVAGVWLQNFSRANAHALIERFESAQLPVFLVWFALAGMRLDLAQLWSMILPVAVIAAARGFALYAGTRVACARTDAPPEIRTWGGVGLIPQAGLTLAIVVAIQTSFPSFGPAVAILLLSVLGMNQLVSPVLLRIALVRSGEAGKKSAVDFAS